MMLQSTARALVLALLPVAVASILPADAGFQGEGSPSRMAIRARFEPATAKPGDTVKLIVDGEVTPGYHIYGKKEETGIVPGFEPSEASLLLLKPKGEWVVPDGRLHVDPNLPDYQSYWIEGKTRFTQEFVVKPGTKSGEITLRGGLSYMACTPELCDPPYTEPLTAKLTVLQGAAVKQDKPLPSVHDGRHQVAEVVLVPATARPGETVKVEVRVAMAPGWHNYGSKQNPSLGEPVTMKVNGAGLELVGGPVIPPGKPHELVGDTYHFLEGAWVMHQTVKVPQGSKPGDFNLSVAISYTACDDGSCDEPVRTAIGAKLVVEAGAARVKTEKPAAAQDKKLPSEHVGNHQAMQVVLVPATARAGEVVSVEVRVQMEPGWHNYGSKQDPELGTPATMRASGDGVTPVGEAVVPPGKPHEIVGSTYYFLDGEWVMRQQLRVADGAKPGPVEVKAEFAYMACDDKTCDNEARGSIGAVLTIEAGAARAEFSKQDDPKAAGSKVAGLEEDGEPKLNDIPLYQYLLLAIGAGLFALVMPCTYPMIPLTVSFFTKQSEKGGRPVLLALVYGGGIVFSYLVLGGLLGPFMQKLATDPWLNLVIGLAFVFFAMSLFGLVELKPPQFLMNSATRAQQMASGSTSLFAAIGGVFLMGLTLCVTSFACTAPILGSMLAAGSNSGGLGRLFLGMGVFGLTMATPFVVLSLVPGRLPKSGVWMNSAKILFGFVELAAAMKFFSNTEFAWNLLILPRELFLMIWAVLFLVAGTYMLGLIRIHGETGEIGGGRLVTGTVVLGLAGYFALGASGLPLDNEVMRAFNPPYSAADGTHGAKPGGGDKNRKTAKTHTIITDDFDEAVQVAKAQEKLLLVNFTGLL